MSRAPALLFLLLVACGRPGDLEGPAPEGALECSLAYAVDAGYELVEGGSDEGFLRLIQRVDSDPASARAPVGDPDLVDIPDETIAENEILVQEDRSRLQFTVLGNAEVEVGTFRSSTAIGQARTMLAMCTASPPVFPGDPGSLEPAPPAAPR